VFAQQSSTNKNLTNTRLLCKKALSKETYKCWALLQKSHTDIRLFGKKALRIKHVCATEPYQQEPDKHRALLQKSLYKRGLQIQGSFAKES